VLAEAQASSKQARRTSARLPKCRPPTADAQKHPARQTETDVNEVDNEARVPAVAEDDAWRTEFLS